LSAIVSARPCSHRAQTLSWMTACRLPPSRCAVPTAVLSRYVTGVHASLPPRCRTWATGCPGCPWHSCYATSLKKPVAVLSYPRPLAWASLVCRLRNPRQLRLGPALAALLQGLVQPLQEA